jgi:hypothetical protein
MSREGSKGRRCPAILKAHQDGDDKGETVAQTVLAVPVVIGIFWMAIQATVFLHGANVASSVAAEAAAAASRNSATYGVGERAAARALADFGATAALPPRLEFFGRDVVATVVVRIPRVAPFFPTTVTRSARESREEFLTESDRQS